MISVIIPTYNRRHLIERCLDSVLQQTYRDLEVLVVDDCSTDGTESLFENYPDVRVYFIRVNEKRGGCHARNVGIENAKGEYLAFQDSDDVWHIDKLEKQLEYLKQTKADVVFAGNRRFMDNKLFDYFPKGISQGKVEYEDFLSKSLINTQTILAKRVCFENVRFNEDLKRFQDTDLILRLSKEFNVYYQDEALVDVYIQKDSITNDPTLFLDSSRYLYETYLRPYLNEPIEHHMESMMNSYQKLINDYNHIRDVYEATINSQNWKMSEKVRKVLDWFKK